MIKVLSPESKRIIKAFIKSLVYAKGVGYDKPMYEAMLEIENDYTLFSLLYRNYTMD